jgi:aspartyl-tRNA(Asn)/glutamyl-tRNA(Gln) amidotransferase subunit B
MAGNEKILGWFVGQIMKTTGGKANPSAVNKLLREKLSKN